MLNVKTNLIGKRDEKECKIWQNSMIFVALRQIGLAEQVGRG